jgi:plastocyanin
MTPARTAAPIVGLIVLIGAGSGCGRDTPNEPSGPPVATNTITITAAGASPRNIQVAAGSRVLFINNDTRSHNMSSDPHPDHNDCPEINQAGLLAPGQRRETGNLVQVRTCGFHDHDLPEVATLRGTIVIR